MAYRINFTVNGSGSTWITNYWDEQASSLTGSVSPIGFNKPSAATLTYKASWTGLTPFRRSGRYASRPVARGGGQGELVRS